MKQVTFERNLAYQQTLQMQMKQHELAKQQEAYEKQQ
jgi:hypothetical protein